MTVGKSNKIVLATRSSHGLEVPLTDEEGNSLVAKEHFLFLCQAANKKFEDNEKKHLKFHLNVVRALDITTT